ncbi:hypothetical protein AB0O11_37830, partial [Kitasatospora sp. NPDC093102]
MRPQTIDMRQTAEPRRMADHGRTGRGAPTAPSTVHASTGPFADQHDRAALRAALAAATEDRIIYDLDGIGRQYAMLCAELPGVAVRFAMKACPVDEVLGHLAALGSGFDAASPQ